MSDEELNREIAEAEAELAELNARRRSLPRIFAEERAAGFNEMSVAQLVTALLNDATEHEITYEIVHGVREVILFLDAEMRAYNGDQDAVTIHNLRHMTALNAGYLEIVDALVGPDPASAWRKYDELAVFARTGLATADPGSLSALPLLLPMPQDELLSESLVGAPEIARPLGVAPSTIWRWARDGLIPSVRRGPCGSTPKPFGRHWIRVSTAGRPFSENGRPPRRRHSPEKKEAMTLMDSFLERNKAIREREIARRRTWVAEIPAHPGSVIIIAHPGQELDRNPVFLLNNFGIRPEELKLLSESSAAPRRTTSTPAIEHSSRELADLVAQQGERQRIEAQLLEDAQAKVAAIEAQRSEGETPAAPRPGRPGTGRLTMHQIHADHRADPEWFSYVSWLSRQKNREDHVGAVARTSPSGRWEQGPVAPDAWSQASAEARVEYNKWYAENYRTVRPVRPPRPESPRSTRLGPCAPHRSHQSMTRPWRSQRRWPTSTRSWASSCATSRRIGARGWRRTCAGSRTGSPSFAGRR